MSVFSSNQGSPASERENGQLPDSDPFLTAVVLSLSEVGLILLIVMPVKLLDQMKLPANNFERNSSRDSTSLTESVQLVA